MTTSANIAAAATEPQSKMDAYADSLTTEQMFAAIDVLDAEHEANNTLSNEKLLVRATLSDAIERRHGLTDAMDTIYEDVNYTGSYTDALRTAYAKVVGA